MAARRIKARSWSTLTAEQWTTLAIGRIRGEPDGFDSETDLRACWAQHRARFMASCNPGHRPGAWWILESPQPYDPNVPEPQQLRALGLLTPEESELLSNVVKLRPRESR